MDYVHGKLTLYGHISSLLIPFGKYIQVFLILDFHRNVRKVFSSVLFVCLFSEQQDKVSLITLLSGRHTTNSITNNKQ